MGWFSKKEAEVEKTTDTDKRFERIKERFKIGKKFIINGVSCVVVSYHKANLPFWTNSISFILRTEQNEIKFLNFPETCFDYLDGVQDV